MSLIHLSPTESATLKKWLDSSIEKKNKHDSSEKSIEYDTNQFVRVSSPEPYKSISRFGFRESFLDNAINIFMEDGRKSLVYGAFFTGYTSHITFISENGKIYSWLEYLGEGDEKTVILNN
jgi:hypothetical protein